MHAGRMTITPNCKIPGHDTSLSSDSMDTIRESEAMLQTSYESLQALSANAVINATELLCSSQNREQLHINMSTE